MRVVALIAVLACATAAHADGSRESRYGPAPERAPVPRDGQSPGFSGQPYMGRALGWAGKREVIEASVPAAAEVQPWWARGAPSQPPQPARVVDSAPAPRRDLPQSLYDAPPPAAAPAPTFAYAAPVPQSQTALRPGQIGARTYSVGRQFGMTPDPIPPAGPSRMVLIAPPAGAPEDETKARGDGEWSAQPEKDGQ